MNDEQRQTTKSPNANGIHAGAGAGPLESSPSCRVSRSHLPCLLVTENTNGRGLREQARGTGGGNGNGNVNGVVLQERCILTVGQKSLMFVVVRAAIRRQKNAHT